VIALLTVTSHAIRAGTANPVEPRAMSGAEIPLCGIESSAYMNDVERRRSASGGWSLSGTNNKKKGQVEMKDVSIPLPDFMDKQIAEIEVKINGKKRQYNFRVEPFRWEPDNETWDVEKRIKTLQDGLEKYDKSWELIQIFRPKDGSKFIQVLYRQRQSLNAITD
jgi:hypothetical protein